MRLAGAFQIACVLTVLAVTTAAPADDSRPEIIEIISPAAGAKETLDSLNLGEPGSELSERNKRTIGILRQLFPTLTQLLEQKVNDITSALFQTVGKALLSSTLGGGNRPQSGGSIDDDDSDEDDDSGVKVSVQLPTYPPDEEEETETVTTPLIDIKRERTENDSNETRRKRRRSLETGGTSAANADENQLLSGAESQQSEVRVQFAEAEGKADQDQETAAQTNSAQIDDLSLEDADNSDENRDKRFLNFGLGGGSSGSGGGSGNFLFDIIRRPAESMARAAGQAFRFIAGTDSFGLGITATHTATRDVPPVQPVPPAPSNSTQLVAGSSGGGSSAAPQDAGAADATAAVDNADGVAKGDGYTEGIPGPITRLFIIANRGIANLIQDLILRLAQTSERIVNFKARLITSII